jgi:transcriptional regulator with PAS, ATPase and Fis domain
MATTQSCEVGNVSGGGKRGVLLYVGSAQAGGAARGNRIWFADGLTIGREDGGWRIEDSRVSARHARVRQQGGTFFIQDLGSRNGTLVDGQPVSSPRELRDGAIVFVAGHAAVFRMVTNEQLMAIRDELNGPLGPVPTLSPRLAQMLQRVRRMATSSLPLLLTGETGVGKEVIARAVHAASGRSGRFLPINCAALPGELVESELYGYERGAHSQAHKRKAGLFELAQSGTLFLDEIGDMPLSAQAKLLRFLDDHEVLPLGGITPLKLDVRILAATSQLEPAAGVPGLRADLRGRLTGDAVRLPALRERPEDLGGLVEHLLAGQSVRILTPAAFQALTVYQWPLNVRELRRVLAEAALMAAGREAIGLEDLPDRLTAEVIVPPSPKRRAPRPLPTREELERLFEQHHGNLAEVARQLDRHWQVVSRAAVRHGLDVDRWRRG